jgi:hypothetical protein
LGGGARQVEANLSVQTLLLHRARWGLLVGRVSSALGPRAPSPSAPPAQGLPRKAHRYLNFDFILFYFISLLPRAGAIPPGTAAPRPPPRASLYYCNKCAYKGTGSRARWGWGGAAERGCNFPKPEPEGEWAGWRWRRGTRGRGEDSPISSSEGRTPCSSSRLFCWLQHTPTHSPCS